MQNLKTYFELFENADAINDHFIVTGVEDGWLKLDKTAWEKYLKAKERLKIIDYYKNILKYIDTYNRY